MTDPSSTNEITFPAPTPARSAQVILSSLLVAREAMAKAAEAVTVAAKTYREHEDEATSSTRVLDLQGAMNLLNEQVVQIAGDWAFVSAWRDAPRNRDEQQEEQE